MPTLVSAVIRPHALVGVTTALKRAGVLGVTVSQVHGTGRQGGHTQIYRGSEYTIDLLPKLLVEAVVGTDDAPAVVAVIRDAAASGTIGDGKIWTTPVDHLRRVRTGETGDHAV
jgi:nitrogen regulatory protein P-II 1